MPVYYGFELDVLQSLVQFFSLPDPLISPKLYDLYMAVLRKFPQLPSTLCCVGMLLHYPLIPFPQS